MSWKLSVLTSMPNLVRGRNYFSTLGSAHVAGSVLNLADSNSVEALMEGDIIKIGPSSTVTDVSKFEYRRAKTMSYTSDDTKILMDSAFTNTYSIGDEVSSVGSLFPDGWFRTDSSTAALVFHGIHPKIGTTGRVLGGYLNNVNGFWMRKTSGGDATVFLDVKVYNEYIDVPNTYRMGVQWLLDSQVSFSQLQFRETGVVLGEVTTSGNTINVWSKDEVVFNPLVPGTTDYRIGIRSSTSNTFDRLGIGFVYVTHAMMTSGEAAGTYTLPGNPTSVIELNDDKGISIKTFDTRSVINISSLSNLPARGYQITFSNADETFLRNLEILQYWQDRGFPLMLESDIVDSRPVIGYMRWNHSFNTWDYDNNIGVSFTFRGI